MPVTMLMSPAAREGDIMHRDDVGAKCDKALQLLSWLDMYQMRTICLDPRTFSTASLTTTRASHHHFIHRRSSHGLRISRILERNRCKDAM